MTTTQTPMTTADYGYLALSFEVPLRQSDRSGQDVAMVGMAEAAERAFESALDGYLRAASEMKRAAEEAIRQAELAADGLPSVLSDIGQSPRDFSGAYHALQVARSQMASTRWSLLKMGATDQAPEGN